MAQVGVFKALLLTKSRKDRDYFLTITASK
jgi:hypothetical protein